MERVSLVNSCTSHVFLIDYHWWACQTFHASWTGGYNTAFQHPPQKNVPRTYFSKSAAKSKSKAKEPQEKDPDDKDPKE